MELLFFDIECCDGKHICEFGYIITDMQFNVLEQEVITINPEMPFVLSGRPNQRDIELFFSDAKYYMSPIFTEYYDKIKGLIEAPERLIFGHALDNDAKFLRTACERYGLENINFRFCDGQRLFDVEMKTENSISLEDAITALELPRPEYFHRSDCDAYASMLVIKALCQRLEMSPDMLFEHCEYSVGTIENGVITLNNERFKWEKMLSELESGRISPKKAHDLLFRFVPRAEKTVEIDAPLIAGKKICFDTSFEKRHVRELLAIVQLIVNAGGAYTNQVELSRIFVNNASKNPKENIRLSIAQSSRKTVMDLKEFLDILGVTRESLAEIPLPSVDILMKYVKPAPPPRRVMTAGDGKPTTLGDILRKKGIVFNE